MCAVVAGQASVVPSQRGRPETGWANAVKQGGVTKKARPGCWVERLAEKDRL